MSAVLVEQSDAELEAWLRAEIPLRCAEADAHPEMMLTVEDMYQAIDDEMEAIRHEQGLTQSNR